MQQFREVKQDQNHSSPFSSSSSSKVILSVFCWSFTGGDGGWGELSEEERGRCSVFASSS